MVASANQPSSVLAQIPLVSEFFDLFPNEVPGLLQAREVEFAIDLVPVMMPISRAPYRMAPHELRVFKV